jgi:hypothetical protein
MCNDETSRGNTTHLIDQIVALLAEFPDLPAEGAEKAQ